jgi:hypothetical protein
MTQVVEHLICKCKALSLNPKPTHTHKKKSGPVIPILAYFYNYLFALATQPQIAFRGANKSCWAFLGTDPQLLSVFPYLTLTP